MTQKLSKEIGNNSGRNSTLSLNSRVLGYLYDNGPCSIEELVVMMGHAIPPEKAYRYYEVSLKDSRNRPLQDLDQQVNRGRRIGISNAIGYLSGRGRILRSRGIAKNKANPSVWAISTKGKKWLEDSKRW